LKINKYESMVKTLKSLRELHITKRKKKLKPVSFNKNQPLGHISHIRL